MNIPKRDGTGNITFAEFAKDHFEHTHCVACGNCLLDPSFQVRFSIPVWCVGCRDRIKATLPDGVPPPWSWLS